MGAPESSAAKLDVDIAGVLRSIPHRYPFLLIDSVRDIVPFESATGIKTVTANEPYFQGHFPGHPIMPGVLIVEAMAQTAAVFVVQSLGLESEGKLVYIHVHRRREVPQAGSPGRPFAAERAQAAAAWPGLAVQGRRPGGRQTGRRSDDLSHDQGPVMPDIHPTAVVDDGAKIAETVSIGPYCVVGADVELQDGVQLLAHAVVQGRTRIGPGSRIFPFASIGTVPQDLKYRGEPSELIVGSNTIIREHVTMNPGTERGGMVTQVGDNCLLMVGAHVAHDCILGDHVIMANNATLAGHVTVGDYAIVGGLSAVHQYVRIGPHAMVGGMSGVEFDVIPYGSVLGDRARLCGLNLVGLKRRGFSKDDIDSLRKAYRMLFAEEGTIRERVEDVASEFSDSMLVNDVLEFVRSVITAESKRSLTQPR